MKKTCAVLIMIMMLITYALAATYPCDGMANTQDVRMRSKANSSGKVTATLTKGTVVTVLELIENKTSAWYKVQTEQGKIGYILSDYLSVPETEYIENAKASEQACRMYVTVHASCADMNGVGKNWTQYFELNGIRIEQLAADVIVAPEVPLCVYARVREQDKKPDTGMELTTYTPTQDDMQGFEIVQTVKVVENSGRYAGNTALWKIRYTFEPAPPEDQE